MIASKASACIRSRERTPLSDGELWRRVVLITSHHCHLQDKGREKCMEAPGRTVPTGRTCLCRLLLIVRPATGAAARRRTNLLRPRVTAKRFVRFCVIRTCLAGR